MAVIPPDDFAMSLPSLREFGRGDLIKAEALATTLIGHLSELEWAARTFVGDSPWGPGDWKSDERVPFIHSLAWFASHWAFFDWELRNFMHTVSSELMAGRKRPVRHKRWGRTCCWALLPFEVLSQLTILQEVHGLFARCINEEDEECEERARRSVGAFIRREFPDVFKMPLDFMEKWQAVANEEARSRFVSEYVDDLLTEPSSPMLNKFLIPVPDTPSFDSSSESNEQSEEPTQPPEAQSKEAAIKTLDFESVTMNIFQLLTDLDLERLLFNVTAEFAAAARTRTLAGIPLSHSASPPKRRISQGEANVKAREYLLRNAAREQQGNPVGVRELASYVGCSSGLISSLPAWRAVVEEREKRRMPKAPDAVNLSDKVLATTGQEDEELNRLIADQQADFEPSPLDTDQRKVRERKRL